MQLNYASAILAVKINRERLVVVLETTVYIYDITTMSELHTIDQVPANPAGVNRNGCPGAPPIFILVFASLVIGCLLNRLQRMDARRHALLTWANVCVYIWFVYAPHTHVAGICALACSQNVPGDSDQQNNFFAYPGSIEKGEVYVYDVLNLVRDVPHVCTAVCVSACHC